MKHLQTLMIAAVVLTLSASLSLEARTAQQIEADIKQVKADMQRCTENMNTLGKWITETTADRYSSVKIRDLQFWRDSHAEKMRCYQNLSKRLADLKKELAALPPPPTAKGGGADPHRHQLDEVNRLNAEVAATLAKLRDFAAKLKALEARAERK
jgi:hypothetical protein